MNVEYKFDIQNKLSIQNKENIQNKIERTFSKLVDIEFAKRGLNFLNWPFRLIDVEFFAVRESL